MFECMNITSFEMQKDALFRSKAKVIFFQEHKVRKKEQKHMKKQAREAGWSIHFSPSNEGGKKASAGVGVMWRDDEVKVYPEKVRLET